eukprot:CAMPEP_0116842290 /NCGR_PEP_ID=MMETSP0418-20121206/11428_1 /TAXON_ID=1158023 /ORGANISM="Astrosyne radiata, Strain 13vi08-1A" /LENGTH=191 /DNA_ID=CAMNT_0004472871 /DNA_START=122 /DNA_END=697 /DNA_ORIENTATION=-
MKNRALFLKFTKKKKEAMEGKYEMKREALEAEYETNQSTLEREYTTSLSTLETEYATKQSALDRWYKKQQEKLDQVMEYWTSETMEELVEDVKDQMKLLDLHLGGDASSTSGDQSNEGITSLVLCPIGGKRMVDPVVAADGYTYERSEIEDHFEKTLSDSRGVISPVTGEPMTHCRLAPNVAIREIASLCV